VLGTIGIIVVCVVVLIVITLTVIGIVVYLKKRKHRQSKAYRKSAMQEISKPPTELPLLGEEQKRGSIDYD